MHFLHELRRRYRNRPIALLLDEDSSHTAGPSQTLAAKLNIRLIWLPIRSPEHNSIEHLWRSPKEKIAANRQDCTIEQAVDRFLGYLHRLTPRAALRKAGVLCARFWLRAALSKLFLRPTWRRPENLAGTYPQRQIDDVA